MIKEREPLIERFSVLFQVLITILSFYLTAWLFKYYNGQLPYNFKEFIYYSFLIAPIWFILLELFDLGAMARIQRYRHLVKKYIGVVVIGSTVLFIVSHLLEIGHMSNTEFLIFGGLNFLFLFAQKAIGRTIVKYFRSKGYNTRIVLIIADNSSIPFIDQLIECNHWGYIIGGIISNSDAIKERYGDQYYIISEKENFEKFIDEEIIDEVFFCKNNFKTKELEYYISKCREIGIIFHLQSEVLKFAGLNPRLSTLQHRYFLSFRNTPENYLALMVKRAIDYLLSITILIFSFPVMTIIALLIKLEDRGPVFFKQVRVGKNGRHFKCLKFRTMVTDAEEMKENLMPQNEQEGPIFKMKNDPRITRIGKFLRKTSIDEFPQFINVLMGDMSIVGPRPPVPSEVKQYKRNITRRLSINPGITCIWQVSGRNNLSFDKWMEMDMQYIDNWSLKLDFIIMLKTFKVIFSANGQ